jgi:hypothetical protein
VLWQQYTGALRDAADPDTPLWASATLYALAGLASIVANVEEATRQVANAVGSWGIDAGQHVGRAQEWSAQDESGEATAEYLNAVANLAAGFDSLALYLESMLQSGATQNSLRGVGQWWNTGSKNDAAWRALSWSEKGYYEIGQRTTSLAEYERLANLDPVTRGRAMWEQQGVRALFSNYPQLANTMRTGPTPAIRFLAPYVAMFLYGLGIELEAYHFAGDQR